MDMTKPAWAQFLPHGKEILLLDDCELDGPDRAWGTTLLRHTHLGADKEAIPIFWGLEMLAQTAAALPVKGDPAGPREGYLVKADTVRYEVASLPTNEVLRTCAERVSQSSTGLYLCKGHIVRVADPETPLFSARFFLWNRAAGQA